MPRVLTRTTDLCTLLADSSISIYSHQAYRDWSQIHKYYSGFKSMPLQKPQKNLLSHELWRSLDISIITIERPDIMVYRWANGELRWFIISEGGFLIESESNETWDSYFPWLKKDSRGCITMACPSKTFEMRGKPLLWSPLTSNYTHFLYDTFAGLVHAGNKVSHSLLSSLTLPSSSEIPEWQLDFFHNLGLPCKTLNIDNLLPMPNQIYCIKPDLLYLPVLVNKGIAFSILKEWIEHRRGFLGLEQEKSNSLIFATRSDLRRSRIKNISEIEELVSRLGGQVVDVAQLSLADKYRVFNGASCVIGESAGPLNGALFSSSSCKIVNLVDAQVVKGPDFIVGGWAYHLGYAHQCRYIIGKDGELLHGSPLGMSHYSINEIRIAMHEPRAPKSQQGI